MDSPVSTKGEFSFITVKVRDQTPFKPFKPFGYYKIKSSFLPQILESVRLSIFVFSTKNTIEDEDTKDVTLEKGTRFLTVAWRAPPDFSFV